MTSRNLAALRREYLFGLAHLCHLGPVQVDDLDLDDFAALTDDIDAYLKAAAPKG
jgi:hypothetical protein